MDKILSLTSATGWSAVYKNKGDGSIFSVPLVSWALVDDWDEYVWQSEEGYKAIVGMVLSPNRYTIVAAAEVEHVEDEAPALFCGYLEPGSKLEDTEWKPIWG